MRNIFLLHGLHHCLLNLETKTNTNLLPSIQGGHLNILPPPRGQGPPCSTTKSLKTAALLSFQKVSSRLDNRCLKPNPTCDSCAVCTKRPQRPDCQGNSVTAQCRVGSFPSTGRTIKQEKNIKMIYLGLCKTSLSSRIS